MGNHRVKFFIDEDGQEDDSDIWHLITISLGDPVSFCGGQVFGYGQGTIAIEGTDYEESEGRITCERCRDLIKEIKAVDLR